MSQHTPGPWAANLFKVESEHEHGWENDGWALCECMGPDAEANAKLMAAAPKLLAALKQAVPLIESEHGDAPFEIYEAIKQAEGT